MGLKLVSSVGFARFTTSCTDSFTSALNRVARSTTCSLSDVCTVGVLVLAFVCLRLIIRQFSVAVVHFIKSGTRGAAHAFHNIGGVTAGSRTLGKIGTVREVVFATNTEYRKTPPVSSSISVVHRAHGGLHGVKHVVVSS
jgi:hypothetical protein